MKLQPVHLIYSKQLTIWGKPWFCVLKKKAQQPAVDQFLIGYTLCQKVEIDEILAWIGEAGCGLACWIYWQFLPDRTHVLSAL